MTVKLIKLINNRPTSKVNKAACIGYLNAAGMNALAQPVRWYLAAGGLVIVTVTAPEQPGQLLVMLCAFGGFQLSIDCSAHTIDRQKAQQSMDCAKNIYYHREILLLQYSLFARVGQGWSHVAGFLV